MQTNSITSQTAKTFLKTNTHLNNQQPNTIEHKQTINKTKNKQDTQHKQTKHAQQATHIQTQAK